nr:protein NLP2-like [Ipomoea batatas]
MGDGSSAPNPNHIFGTGSSSHDNNTVDITLMDELLLDGFWLETTEGSNFWQPAAPFTSPSNPLDSPSSYFPTTSHSNSTAQFTPNQFHNHFPQQTTQNSTFLHMEELDAEYQTNNPDSVPPSSSSPNQPPTFMLQGTEMNNKRLWIGPNRSNPTPTASVKKRLVQAIEYLKESTRDKDVLIQIWVPVNSRGRHVLTTNNQPFFLNPNCKSLADYRHVSRNYQFAADNNSKELVGLPGRVFLNKLPEWTPDVRFFRREEYPRVTHAKQYNVSGSLALPVFERGSGTCLGVVEIVTTFQKANYSPELQDVCKALEAVDLRSSGVSSPLDEQICNQSYQATLEEIQDVLKCVCDTHKLPMAQTWAPCIQQGKGGCRHSDENYTSCVSTIESACYVRVPQVLEFHQACSEHHLLKGEGVAGGAFMTNQPCFATDVTAFSKTEYPLSHHARIFGLCAAVAIRLRSIHTGSADFVLEFFLPPDCKGNEEQKQMLHSLSSVIEQICRTLRVVTDQELAVETPFPDQERGFPSAGGLDKEKSKKLVSPPPRDPSQEASSWFTHMMDAQSKGKSTSVSFSNNKDELEENFNLTTNWEKTDVEDSGPKESANSSGDFSSGAKRRTKTEKTISLQVLRQYFAGSLKDAARSIGVCPTTLKRICRQHGITRWPSRKIKKVGHSLRKLQLVIDSVQGAEGAIQLSSFYSSFPELGSQSLQGTSNYSASKMNDQLQQVTTQPEGILPLSPGTTCSKSTSSCSHSSSSSFNCSARANQSPFTLNSSAGGDASSAEQSGEMLKRARSDAELHGLGQEDTKLLVRSHSQKIISSHSFQETLAPLSNSTSHTLQNACTFRVKATFGEEKIRFSLQPHWRFGDLQHEILARFNIQDGSKFDIKYLDDDSEWVLLTCDADLEECIDIHRSSKSRTIKLSLHYANNLKHGSSSGSRGEYLM